MYSDLKANNITVKSFRGISKEVSLDLNDITILYGVNGTGKSSFVNSLEYLFSDDLSFLKRSTIKKKESSYNLNASKKDVKIELNMGDEFYRLKGSKKTHSDGLDDVLDNPFMKNASFILNRKKILDFIEGTQTNRYNAIMDLCGIKELDKIQSVLSSSKSTLKKELSSKESDIDSNLDYLENLHEMYKSYMENLENLRKNIEFDIKNLAEMSEKIEVDYEEYINEVNEILKNMDFDAVDTNTNLNEYKNNLDFSDYINLDNKIKEFKQVYEDLDLNINDDLNNILDEYEHIASNNLKSSQYLINTLKTSAEYIELTDTDTCPICSNEIDSSKIIDEIKSKIDGINSSSKSFKIWKKNLKSLILNINEKLVQCNNLNRLIDNINDLSDKNLGTVDISILSNLINDLEEFSKFKKVPSDFDEINLDEIINSYKLIYSDLDESGSDKNIDEYNKILAKLSEEQLFVHRRRDIKVKAEQIDKNQNDVGRLEEQINQNKINVEELEKQIEEQELELKSFDKHFKLVDTIFDVFTKTKEDYINDLIFEIKEDIKYFYDYIHGDDSIMSPEMIVSGAKKIDVFLDSFGNLVDSRSFASEGHLDTLGICIFLAFNKKFNSLPLMVLDDVFTTIDLNHKEKIAELIVNELSDYQFVITAHNESWVNKLEETCQVSNRQFVSYEIIDWSLENGPEVIGRF